MYCTAKANNPYSSSFPASTKLVMFIGARPASAATAMDVRGLSGKPPPEPKRALPRSESVKPPEPKLCFGVRPQASLSRRWPLRRRPPMSPAVRRSWLRTPQMQKPQEASCAVAESSRRVRGIQRAPSAENHPGCTAQTRTRLHRAAGRVSTTSQKTSRLIAATIPVWKWRSGSLQRPIMIRSRERVRHATSFAASFWQREVKLQGVSNASTPTDSFQRPSCGSRAPGIRFIARNRPGIKFQAPSASQSRPSRNSISLPWANSIR